MRSNDLFEAMMRIIKALESGRPVFAFTGDQKWTPISGVGVFNGYLVAFPTDQESPIAPRATVDRKIAVVEISENVSEVLYDPPLREFYSFSKKSYPAQDISTS